MKILPIFLVRLSNLDNQIIQAGTPVKANGGDLTKFEKDWHKRACAAYRKNVRPGNIDDINKFRSGGFSV